MFNQFFGMPMVQDLKHPGQFQLRLGDNISDLVLIQALRAPLLEVVVAACEPTQLLLTVRCQPLFELQCAKEQATASVESLLARGRGQGFRLYCRLGVAPARLLESLRRGLRLDFIPDSPGHFALLDNEHFELLALEEDLRLLNEPQALSHARAILAREFDYGLGVAMLAVHISELEQASRELLAFLESTAKHTVLQDEARRMVPLLNQKRQWLLRRHSQLQERTHYGHSANQMDELESLKQQLECYQLLATPEVTAMVQALVKEDS
ncbi:hypothetical protein [Shewanella cyperi]|uniref:Uncharacterized protein n=1 Tax=Shewanella cyperi TaxID=2814292 RepID=A0A974XN73_9GAMM|nr:hypothetical protein [Shewanella cyperi]QSX31491.1 hypothetical protein JYB88_07710 [Shewanella cyperi]QSX42271.1 hypothetical protein JYB84_07715 [Shewanella cyperi]